MYSAVGAVQVPGLAVADIAVQLQGAVLSKYAHRVNAGIDAVGQGKINDAVLAAEGDGRLCHMAGEGVKPTALSAGQQHGYNFFFHINSPQIQRWAPSWSPFFSSQGNDGYSGKP